MDYILEMRMWWAMAIIFCGVVLPVIVLFCIQAFKPRMMKWYHLVVAVTIIVLTFAFARDMIPEKYDVKTEQVYQCEWVDKIVPVYPTK